MSDTNKENIIDSGITPDHQKALQHAISQINLDEITKDDVFLDVINRLRRFNFELMVALELLQLKTVAEKAPVEESESEDTRS